ncbi:MAG: hypothetical protein AUI02_05735 [Acidobacteria bacterium 13_2_20CM_2_57_12]|nr:MAG: hypothetical protein AUH01_01360 [Acidobacteria bacterium 13_2_20CM_56_17]OLB94108.1 MAG: hypothetical protein AUI02_05735 [Acidobacteria bacterium 13_2_20CM_2_57_12]
MPNWNRIIIGDAFKIQPAGFDYYRDLFLLWPFLGFSIAATSVLVAPQSAAYRVFGLKLAVCAALALLLAKERVMLVLVASAYVALRMAVAIIFFHTWLTLTLLLVSGGTLLTIFRSGALKNWKPSYVRPKKHYVLDTAVCVSGLGVIMAIAHWMKP